MSVRCGAEEALRAGAIRNIFFGFGVHQTKNGESFRDFFDYLGGFGVSLYKSMRGRSFFGVGSDSEHRPHLEPDSKAVEKILACLDEPHPAYRGPRVVGRIS
jgi:hypothetical protein